LLFTVTIVLAFSGHAERATTLTGYALKDKNIQSTPERVAGALVQFRDARTGLPARVKILIGERIAGRNDALYSTARGDIGRWEVSVPPGRYNVRVSGGALLPKEAYTLTMLAQAACTCNASSGSLNVKDCGAIGDGLTDDTDAIGCALSKLNAIGGGKLYFPAGTYKVSGSHTYPLPLLLPSGVTIEGTNGGLSYGTNIGNCVIKLQPVHQPLAALFKIGEGIKHVAIRDIALSSSTTSGTTAILAEGLYPHTSLEFIFSNISFINFEYGIRVSPTNCDINSTCSDAWQFDDVKADFLSFIGCKFGIYIDTENSDWLITNVFNLMPARDSATEPQSSAFYFKRAGFIQIEHALGGGVPDTGGNFIYAGHLGSLFVTNSQVENVTNAFVWGHPRPQPDTPDEGDTTARIIFIGNQWGYPVLIRHRVTFISMANHYGKSVVTNLSPYARIYSTGDRFCYDPGIGAPAPAPSPSPAPSPEDCSAAYGFQEGPGVSGTIVFESGQPKESYNNNNGASVAERPAQFNTRPVLNKGVDVNGVLQFAPAFTYLQLTQPPAPPDGAFVYCSDCKLDSSGSCVSPATPGATGNGAFAKRINGAWKCN
jgi:hypothetical protein